MDEKWPYLQYDAWRRIQALKDKGWVKCPECEGMGNIADRFTHRIVVCPKCDGQAIVPPAKKAAD